MVRQTLPVRLQRVTRSHAHSGLVYVHDYLQRNDSYHFFECVDDLVKTGPTGTNVMDIHIMLAQKS